MLTSGQLPDYVVNERLLEMADEANVVCGELGPVEEPIAMASTALSHRDVASLPEDEVVTLLQSIAVYRDTEAATRHVDSLRRVGVCSDAGSPENDIPSMAYSRTEAPPRGDQAVSFSIEMDGGLVDLDSEVSLVRLGDTVVSVGTWAMYDAPTTIPDGVVAQAVERVETAATH